MPRESRAYGIFEYGDVYDYDQETDGRGPRIGKLIIDQDQERFYIKPDGANARNVARERVAWMISHDLIDFYQDDSRTLLVEYLMKIDANNNAIKEQRRRQYASDKITKSLQENTKLVSKTKRRALMSGIFWSLGCIAIVCLGIVMAIPTPEPAPAEKSIAGVGMQYPVDEEVLSNATYMTAIGNGAELYGMILDNEIIESGQQNSNESPIKENVLINASVSQTYPIHMRPLYYDRSSFYQSQLTLNDAEQGSSGVLLQNPNGYSLGKPANELVMFGGRGMSSIVLSSPESFQAQTASETARAIEQAQEEAAQAALGRGSNTKAQEEYLAAEMPDSWNGYDAADIDSNIVAASYWYTKDSTLKREDLKRRVVIWDISSVYNKGVKGVGDLEPIQMNYQDRDSDFYAPVVSMSPSSNGSRYWIGYMKKTNNGDTGFFIREYENAEDILLESYDNTYSTKDLTGNDYPITNYQLHGDRLFFEQQGYIWVMDLSKASIEVDGTQRTIKKENPMRICKSSEIRPTVSRDEQRIASVENTTTVPISHYQVLTMTTQNGQVVYGIAFIEADTGNLVFQPCNGATVAAAEKSEGAGGNTGTASEVGSSDEAALDKAKEKDQSRGSQSNTSQPSSNENTNAENGSANAAADSGNPIVSGGDTLIDTGRDQQQAVTSSQSIVPLEQTAYTLQLTDDEASADTGRILIKAGSTDVQIVCFCVRGEQFYWIEQNADTNQRRIMCSPIYYKNDASQIDSDVMEDVGDNGEIIKDGLQPDDENKATQSTTGDVALDNTQIQGQERGQQQQEPQDQQQPQQQDPVQDQSQQPQDDITTQ